MGKSFLLFRAQAGGNLDTSLDWQLKLLPPPLRHRVGAPHGQPWDVGQREGGVCSLLSLCFFSGTEEPFLLSSALARDFKDPVIFSVFLSVSPSAFLPTGEPRICKFSELFRLCLLTRKWSCWVPGGSEFPEAPTGGWVLWKALLM